MSKKAVLLGLAAAGIAAIVIALAMQPRPDAGETTVANTTVIAEAAPVIDVVSTPSAFPFVERWVAQYSDRGAGEVNVDYEDEIEGLGKSDLAIVGNASGNGTFIPVSPQAVAIVYNVPSFPDVPSGMKLNATVLSAILDGNISRWNNASISSLNPDLNLPNERIVVVHESGNSSSLALIENYLGKIRWSNDSVTVSDPAELASTVRKTPYSIGYVDYSYAVQTKMTFAAVANSYDMHVVPSIESIGEAIETGGKVQDIPFINASRLENSSYPLVGLYYAALADDTENATADFASWLVDKSGGQQTLAEVQYPSIYDSKDLAAYAINNTRFD